MKSGGAFFSAKLPRMGNERENEVIRQCCIAWGQATYDATDNVETVDEKEQHEKKRRSVSFRICYGEEPIVYPPGYVRKRGEKLKKRKYMKCRATGFSNTATIMSAIEKGDWILCVGKTAYQSFINKKGEKVNYYELNVDIAIPMGLIGFLMRLYASETIQKILAEDEEKQGDTWLE